MFKLQCNLVYIVDIELKLIKCIHSTHLQANKKALIERTQSIMKMHMYSAYLCEVLSNARYHVCLASARGQRAGDSTIYFFFWGGLEIVKSKVFSPFFSLCYLVSPSYLINFPKSSTTSDSVSAYLGKSFIQFFLGLKSLVHKA